MRVASLVALFVAAGSPGIAQAPSAFLNQYCVACHNARLKTGGLVLNPNEKIADHPDVWEKVVNKLRTENMPPLGAPRPNAAQYSAAATALETELDRLAAASPNMGKLPLAHRLSRTEYGNAIRDLLSIENLPKEIDLSILLPQDNNSSGFDNLADLLFVPPASMERYLDAAAKLSRLAMGDPAAPAMVNSYRMSVEQPQDARAEDLPLGTRGGTLIRSEFPLTGEYTVKVELAGNARDTHQLEVSVDGGRVELKQIGGAGGRGRGAAAPNEFQIPLTAGPHAIGVTFVQHTQARDETTLRPRPRSTGTLPAISRVTIMGPNSIVGAGDTPSRRKLLTCKPEGDGEACATRILTTLARQAYRREVTSQDVSRLMPFYRAGKQERDFDLGIQKALERVLVSPNFLFRVEKPGPGKISDTELASRLSFFLWSSIPDDELLNLAANGRLRSELGNQVQRMLADKRSEALINNFAAQWLYLRDLEAKNPDEVLFPDFDENLRTGFRRETELFLNSILRENRSVLELLSANYTFLNERLAKHYGVPNIQGSHFRRITFPDGSPRGGLLGQGSVLTITSYANRTSAVVRGKWVLENLLNAAPPPPPPNVPALKTETAEPGKTLTMREAMTQHRADPQCAGCHARMDPIGFSMENFDAIGKWRERDSDSPIDASGTFPGGASFNGVAGLKKELLSHPDPFVQTIAEKLLMYALGRNLQYYDAPAVRTVVRQSKPRNSTLAAMVEAIVELPQFQSR